MEETFGESPVFYGVNDRNKFSPTIVEKAKEQIENNFESLYQQLRARVEERYKQGIGIIEDKQKLENGDQEAINKKLDELF